KQDVVDALNKKNYDNLATEENIEVIDGKALFKSNDEIEVFDENNQLIDTFTSEHIVINTGAIPIIPNIDGVKTSKRLYDSEGIMELQKQPKRLVIVGGRYIALEFASIFNNLGTDVTVLEKGDTLMPKEDKEIKDSKYTIIRDLSESKIQIITDVKTERFENNEDYTIVHTTKGEFNADAVLLATGREPNIDLGLENTDIKLTDKNEIKVDEYLN